MNDKTLTKQAEFSCSAIWAIILGVVACNIVGARANGYWGIYAIPYPSRVRIRTSALTVISTMTWPNDLSKAAIRARNARNTLVSTCQTSHALVRVCTIGAGDGCCGGCRTVVSRRAFNRIGCFALAVITCWTGIATGLTCIVLVVTLKINHFKPNKVKIRRFQRMRNENPDFCVVKWWVLPGVNEGKNRLSAHPRFYVKRVTLMP